MNVYESSFLSIEKRDKMLLQKWTDKELTTDDFQNELLQFIICYEKIKPKSALWNHENFDLKVPAKLYGWIEENINKREFEGGIRNVAFTVSKETLAHISVVKAFNSVESVLHPKYFLYELEALQFLNGEDCPEPMDKFNYNVMNEDHHSTISCDISYNNLPKALYAIEGLNRDMEFVICNKQRFESLTAKELEIFKLVIVGLSNKDIGDLLFIQECTVETHRKRIIKKLGVKSYFDWFRFAKAFQVIQL